MSESKYTPGPWKVMHDTATAAAVIQSLDSKSKYPSIAVMMGGLAESEADALLIASAPALLEALQLFVCAVSTNGALSALSHELEVGRAALDAARGEEASK